MSRSRHRESRIPPRVPLGAALPRPFGAGHRARRAVSIAIGLLAVPALVGCSGGGPADRTGFISTYDQLDGNEVSARYVAPEIASYDRFMVEPVTIDIPADLPERDAAARRELADYTRRAVEDSLRDGFEIARAAGPGVARVRLAITNVAKPVALLNLHPGTKLTGAGLGGASVEGEIVDSVSGRQLLAIVESRRGSQAELDTFDEYDDARDAADAWAAWIRRSIDEARAAGTGAAR